ncbi:MAG TPA: hypothetical protein PLY40_08475 [Bacillota bacterium]|nr:hypothetical protein [Bacillota bacterium]
MIQIIKRSNIFVFFVLLLVVCLLSASLAAAQEEGGGSGDNPGGEGTEENSDNGPGEEGTPGNNPGENPGEDRDKESGHLEDEERSGGDASPPGIEDADPAEPNLELNTLEDNEGYYFPCDSSKSGFVYDDSDPFQLGCADCHAFHQGVSEHLLKP